MKAAVAKPVLYKIEEDEKQGQRAPSSADDFAKDLNEAISKIAQDVKQPEKAVCIEHVGNKSSDSSIRSVDRSPPSSTGFEAETATPGDPSLLLNMVPLLCTTDSLPKSIRRASNETFSATTPSLSSSPSDQSGTTLFSLSDRLDEKKHDPFDDDCEAAQQHTTGWAAKRLSSFYYITKDAPDLVLPEPPSDAEKVGYLITWRKTFSLFGLFAVLSAAAGYWLFAVCKPYFYWYTIVTAWYTLYALMVNLPGLFARDYDYKRHRQVADSWPEEGADVPSVDVYLPCCKEPLEVLANTYKYVKQLRYPDLSKVKVHVLDDGAMEEVRALAAKAGFNYILRTDRPHLKKAGNLRYAFARTDGDYCLILDADFCPRPDFLLEIVPLMEKDKDLCLIQTPQFFRQYRDNTWVEKGAAGVQEAFYRIVMVNRNHWDAAICVGTNALYRRKALEPFGGTAAVPASEDVHTGFFCVDVGWRLGYVPLCLAAGVSPDTARALFSQHCRWATGSTQLFVSKMFWTSKLSVKQKVLYAGGMMYYSNMAFAIFIVPSPAIFLIYFAIEYVRWWNVLFAAPSLLFLIFKSQFWSRQRRDFSLQQIAPIIQYAYLSVFVDRIYGRSFQWAPTGDRKSTDRNRFRNYRMLAIAWEATVIGLVTYGSIWRIFQGHSWFHFCPLLILCGYHLFLHIPFMISK